MGTSAPGIRRFRHEGKPYQIVGYFNHLQVIGSDSFLLSIIIEWVFFLDGMD